MYFGENGGGEILQNRLLLRRRSQRRRDNSISLSALLESLDESRTAFNPFDGIKSPASNRPIHLPLFPANSYGRDLVSFRRAL
ncbi:hypothetical protein GWI33_012215 [Rhynchophorus ferrugineus]|uniref:Uncharacterized protein n=1 Tax=Rhynchophorus ferrugineus TaxID=354439 RepID=A0A834MEC0_RHYFE|nr:hypothetical protein GWI33_012215 [Rhynchophorus ferrugineus]